MRICFLYFLARANTKMASLKLLPVTTKQTPLARLDNRESPLDEYADGSVTELEEIERTATPLSAWYGIVGGGLRIAMGITTFFIMFGLGKTFETGIGYYNWPYWGSASFLWNIGYAFCWASIFEGIFYVGGALVIACADDARNVITNSQVRYGYSWFRTLVDVCVQSAAIFFVAQVAGVTDIMLLTMLVIVRIAVVFFQLDAGTDNVAYHNDVVLGSAEENGGFATALNHLNNVVAQFAFLLFGWAPILLFMIMSILNSPGDTRHWIIVTVPLTGAAVDIFTAICLTLRYTRLGGRFINWLRLPRAFEAIETITTTTRSLYFLTVILIDSVMH